MTKKDDDDYWIVFEGPGVLPESRLRNQEHIAWLEISAQRAVHRSHRVPQRLYGARMKYDEAV